MHRRGPALGLMICVALLVACGDDDAQEQTTTGAGSGLGAAELAGEGDSPAFALVRGRDTLLVERYTLAGNRVSGVMRDPTGGSVEYQTIHSTSGGERSMRVTMRSGAAADAPPVITTYTLRGDSAFLRHERGDSTLQQGEPVPANTLPYMSPSMGMMALVAQSARELVGDSGRVSLLAASVGLNPVVVQPLVYWRADTAWVIGNATSQFRLVFDRGRLLSAESPPQQMHMVRMPDGGAASASIAPPAATPATPQD
ncbi:MAG TPA: hypothetical protein VMN78_06430 [Longimicrobiales bacterium]|nr:hypothetical protein [Longimicrobiales bacterium]